MALEDIIAKIISSKPGLTRKEILSMIETKVKNAKGFLTMESAALSLAAEMGITIETQFRHETQIKDLVSGLSDVTITGRIINVSPPQRFTRQNGKEAIRRSIHIADKTGIIRVNLWNNMAESLPWDRLLDRVIRISHASVRRGVGGILELNLRLRSEIEVEPNGVKPEDYPPLTSFVNKINEITSNMREVSVVGFIERVYQIVTFKRQDGSEGKIRRIELKDYTGKVVLVLWDTYADVISENHAGKYVMLTGLRVKQRFDGQIELHTKENKTKIVLLERKPSGL